MRLIFGFLLLVQFCGGCASLMPLPDEKLRGHELDAFNSSWQFVVSVKLEDSALREGIYRNAWFDAKSNSIVAVVEPREQDWRIPKWIERSWDAQSGALLYSKIIPPPANDRRNPDDSFDKRPSCGPWSLGMGYVLTNSEDGRSFPLFGPKEPVAQNNGFVFSSDCRYLACLFHGVAMFDTRNVAEEAHIRVWDVNEQSMVAWFKVGSRSWSGYRVVGFFPSSPVFLAIAQPVDSSSSYSQLMAFNAETRSCIAALKSGGGTHVSFLPDGQSVLVMGHQDVAIYRLEKRQGLLQEKTTGAPERAAAGS